MQYRSWLVVPGDSEKRLGKALGSGADAIVLDLANGVSPYDLRKARHLCTEWLAVHRQQIAGGARTGRWVRINALDSEHWRDDLIAIMRGAPDGIVLPRSTGPESVRQLGAELYELEQVNGVPSGTTRILPLAGETPHAALSIPAYLEAYHQRLFGLTWRPKTLGDALGATRLRDDSGNWTDALRMVRAQVLVTAHGCGILPIDTAHADPRDEEGLARAAGAARADGFAGMMAIDPAQVPVIHAAFSPSAEETPGLAEISSPVQARAPLRLPA